MIDNGDDGGVSQTMDEQAGGCVSAVSEQTPTIDHLFKFFKCTSFIFFSDDTFRFNILGGLLFRAVLYQTKHVFPFYGFANFYDKEILD